MKCEDSCQKVVFRCRVELRLGRAEKQRAEATKTGYIKTLRKKTLIGMERQTTGS